ncbi:MAG: reverse transcriptase domain-containing protein, partial [Bacteroidota bacterium]
EVAVLADIKQAFLNIGIDKEHRDLLHFLWEDESGNFSVYRFTRLPFGLTCSPFLLNATIRHHLNLFSSESDLVKRLLEDLYVDDVVSGFSTIEEAKVFFEKVMPMMKSAGLLLRKWTSNCKELQSFFDNNPDPASHGSNSGQTFSSSQFDTKVSPSSKRVLGVEWDLSSDDFVFKLHDFIKSCQSISFTKRNVLSVAASLYDPLGFLAPITARIKVLFQMTCKAKLAWDDQLSGGVLIAWKKFIEVISELTEVRIPRLTFVPKARVIELHGFSDSSNDLYCGVVYLRFVIGSQVKTFFLASKSRVAPIKSMSIPRLELLGCLLLSRLIEEISNALETRLKVSRVICWTDSEVALWWINGKSKSWKPWVENRADRVRKVVPKEGWRHIAGVENPADIPTRMDDSFKETLSEKWFDGPDFLQDPSFDSSQNFALNDKLESFKVASSESKKSNNFSSETCLNVTETHTERRVSNVIDNRRFSSLKKLINVTAYVIRFISNVKNRIQRKDITTDGEITSNEYVNALQLWVADEQQNVERSSNFSKVKASLNLFKDTNGIFRLRGRFANSDLTYDEKYPVLLDSSSQFTKLIVLHAHQTVMHHGVETTLANIRKDFWIIKGRK